METCRTALYHRNFHETCFRSSISWHQNFLQEFTICFSLSFSTCVKQILCSHSKCSNFDPAQICQNHIPSPSAFESRGACIQKTPSTPPSCLDQSCHLFYTTPLAVTIAKIVSYHHKMHNNIITELGVEIRSSVSLLDIGCRNLNRHSSPPGKLNSNRV